MKVNINLATDDINPPSDFINFTKKMSKRYTRAVLGKYDISTNDILSAKKVKDEFIIVLPGNNKIRVVGTINLDDRKRQALIATSTKDLLVQYY